MRLSGDPNECGKPSHVSDAGLRFGLSNTQLAATSVLELGSSGRVTWHSALRTLRLGGGGAGITLSRFIREINSDFPNHEGPKRLE
jgi:hypothetical protein